MAADDDDVVVLTATGETLPNGPLDEDGNGVVYLLATPAQAASGESLLSFLENPEKGYVLKEIKGKRYAWKPLTPDLQVVPRVADDIHVFIKGPPATTSGASAPPATTGGESVTEDESKQERLKKLKAIFCSRLENARTYRPCSSRDPHGVLGADLSLTDLGEYAPILGREDTLHALLKANWHVYTQFMTSKSSLWDTFRRQSHVMGIVAFPGAGKTSVGRALPQLLRDGRYQFATPEDRIASLSNLFECTKEEAKEWDQMMETVASKDVFMYHDFVAPVHPEESLSPAQHFALRTLHAAVTRPDGRDELSDGHWIMYTYDDLLLDLQTKAPGLIRTLTFDDVVALIREACGFGNESRIFLSFFFDEIARVKGSFLQPIFREYIRWMYQHRGGNTFVTMVGATNVFNAASLKESGDTGSSKVLFIPVKPLSLEDREQVMLQLVNKVMRSASVCEIRGLTSEMKVLCSLTGGNPRLITFVLRAFLSEDSHPRLCAGELAHVLGEPVLRDQLCRIIQRLWNMTVHVGYFEGFTEVEQHPYLLRAIQASLLRQSVKRSGAIFEQSKAVGEFKKWEDLEGAGVVSVVDALEEGLVRIEFSPLVLHRLAARHEGIFKHSNPDLATMTSDDWKQKEDNDQSCVVFSIYLLKELRRHTGVNLNMFKLEEIFPEDWVVPQYLRTRTFRFPDLPVKVKQFSPQSVTDIERAGTWAICGQRNDGSDTLLVLDEVMEDTVQPFLLFIQSKCSGDPAKEPKANWLLVEQNVKKDVRYLIHLSKTPVPEAKYGLDRFALIFLSDMNNSQAIQEQKYLLDGEEEEEKNPHVKFAWRVVIGKSFGLVDSIAAVRHVRKRQRPI